MLMILHSPKYQGVTAGSLSQTVVHFEVQPALNSEVCVCLCVSTQIAAVLCMHCTLLGTEDCTVFDLASFQEHL